MKHVMLMAAGLALTLAAFAPAEAGGVLLAEDGEARAVLVLPAGAGRRSIEHQSAELLQEFIQRMSGAELAVHTAAEGAMWRQIERAHEGMNFVLVGAEELAAQLGIEKGDIGPGGLRVKTFANGVALLGGPERAEGERGADGAGVRHAAIELLERLGCRYLWPGELGMVVPERPTVAVPQMDYSYTPQIRRRGIRWHSAAHRGVSGVRRRSRAWSGFERLGLEEEQLAEGIEKAREGAPGISWTAWQRLGGSMERWGHSGAGLSDAIRRSGQDVEWYMREHAEWFALQADGTRDQHTTSRWRLCKSNPELIEFVANDIIERRNEDPGLEIVSLCPNDGSGVTSWCQCDDCRALDAEGGPTVTYLIFPERERRGGTRRNVERPSLTDRMVYYWNSIAEKVTEAHPDLRFGVSAYSRFSHPPVERKLHPNLAVRYVPSSVEGFQGWVEAGMENVFWRPNILTGQRRHGRLRSIVGRLCEAMNYLAEAGLVQTDFDSIHNFWATMGMSYYAAARLNWDPRLTPVEIIRDYAEAGFGGGAEHVVEYFQRAEESAPGLDDIPYLRERLNRAEEAADDETVSRRVAFLRVGLNYTHLHELLSDKSARAQAGEDVDRELARRLIDLNCLMLRDLVINHYDAVHASKVVWGSATFGRPGFQHIGGRTVNPSDEALLERVGHPDYGWTGREDSMEEMLAAFGLD